MYVGLEDDLGDPKDASWAHNEIQLGRAQANSTALLQYKEVTAGHASFMVGKDMSFLTDVNNLVMRYNPLSS